MGLEAYLKKEARPTRGADARAAQDAQGADRAGAADAPGMAAHAVERGDGRARRRTRRARLRRTPRATRFQHELDSARRFRALEARRGRRAQPVPGGRRLLVRPVVQRRRGRSRFDGDRRRSSRAGWATSSRSWPHLLDGSRSPPIAARARARGGPSRGEQRRFFHWALEFPEVMIERGGFDAVIGNPPWNTPQPGRQGVLLHLRPRRRSRGRARRAEQNASQGELREDPEIDRRGGRRRAAFTSCRAYAKPSRVASTGSPRTGSCARATPTSSGSSSSGPIPAAPGGRLAQVLPDSVLRLLAGHRSCAAPPRPTAGGALLRLREPPSCFPIDSPHQGRAARCGAQRRAQPRTFAAAFFVGKDAAGLRPRRSLAELPPCSPSSTTMRLGCGSTTCDCWPLRHGRSPSCRRRSTPRSPPAAPRPCRRSTSTSAAGG